MLPNNTLNWPKKAGLKRGYKTHKIVEENLMVRNEWRDI